MYKDLKPVTLAGFEPTICRTRGSRNDHCATPRQDNRSFFRRRFKLLRARQWSSTEQGFQMGHFQTKSPNLG
jgi:hypothetical protein